MSPLTHNAPLTIAPAKTSADFHALEVLQEEIWGISAMDVVPDHLLLTVAKNGGIVLLAQRDNRPVGFTFGFLGKTAEEELKHCSHQAGVIPAEQNTGVGYALKLAQREAVLAQGLALMTWTFDPLQSRNAHFNMRKLGAISRTYLPELYGTMRDALNADIPSDRLEAHWRLNAPDTLRRLAEAISAPEVPVAAILNPCRTDESGFPVPPDAPKKLATRRHFIQIPADIATIKAKNHPLALAWRMHTRELFRHCFSAGYHICDFIYQPADNRAFYVLTN